MNLKLCPTCKTMVFEDMEVCYGCMYRFGSDPEREEAARCEHTGGGGTARKTHHLSLDGWSVRVETSGSMPEGSSLSIVIEPAPRVLAGREVPEEV